MTKKQTDSVIYCQSKSTTAIKRWTFVMISLSNRWSFVLFTQLNFWTIICICN